MKPDFLRVRNYASEVLETARRMAFEANLSAFGESPKYLVHEGENQGFIRPSGEEDYEPMKSMQVGESIETEKIERGDYFATIEFMFKIGKKMGDESVRLMINKLEKHTEKTNSTISINESDDIEEAFKKLVRQTGVNYDRTGERLKQSILSHPNMFEKFEEMVQKGGERLKEEIEEIYRQQKQNWLETENSRKLVD